MTDRRVPPITGPSATQSAPLPPWALRAGRRLLLGPVAWLDAAGPQPLPAARGVQLLGASPWVSLKDPAEQGVSHMSLYTAPSGALVFATGSMQWAWGLDDFNAPQLREARRHPAAEQIMRNVLARFGSRPALT